MARGFRANYKGIGEFLHSPQLARGLVRIGGEIATTAAAIAPRQSGKFSESFYVTAQERPDRVIAIVGNSDIAAISIEFGTEDTPRHLTLTTALAIQIGRP